MRGILHVFRMDAPEGATGESGQRFQVNLSGPGRTYAGTFAETELLDFLREGISLDSTLLNAVLDQLRTSGQTSVGGLDIVENDAALMGLIQSPSER